jgi:ankyrin repeat protein
VDRRRGGTPLQRAVFRGDKDLVELLIANGADVNAKTRKGSTPLYMAKRDGHTEIVEILTKAVEEQKKTEKNP